MTPLHADGSRLRALDVFRGASVAAMILVNNPGSWAHLYPPLAHAPWHGVTPTDLVFPFFLFAVGNALALAMPRWLAQGRRAFWVRVARRTALVFAIGLLLNAAPFWRWDDSGGGGGALVLRDWHTLRVMGVLQRIALAFGAAALVVAACSRGADADLAARRVLWVVVALLAGYWGACEVLAHGPDPYSLEGHFGTHLDRALLGAAHLYRGEGVPFDPEGLAGTVPATAQVLLGWWAGQAVARAARRPRGIDGDTLARLCLAAVVLGVLAYAWQLQMPLNKKLWTSSYVLHTTALALLGLAALLALLNAPGHAPAAGAMAGATARPLDRPWVGAPVRLVLAVGEAFGRNALGLFVLAGLLPRLLSLWRWPEGTAADGTPRWTTPLPWLYRQVFADLGTDPRLGSLAYALAVLAAFSALAWVLHRRGLYWRV